MQEVQKLTSTLWKFSVENDGKIVCLMVILMKNLRGESG